MKQEIYDEVLLEEPDAKIDSKEYKKWETRLHKSIGWIEPLNIARFFIDKNDKPCSSPDKKAIVWSVVTDNNLMMMDFDKQEDAEIYSTLVQIKAKLNRKV